MFCDKLYTLRTERGLSQVELAEKLHKTKQSISNWENNNIMPSIDMLVEIAKFFGVTCDYLLDLDERLFIDATGLNSEHRSHIQTLVDDLRYKS